jgi:hypothetical protein
MLGGFITKVCNLQGFPWIGAGTFVRVFTGNNISEGVIGGTENKGIVGLNNVGAFNGKLKIIPSKKEFKKVRLKTDKRHFVSNNSLEDAITIFFVSMVGWSSVCRRKRREQSK